jgi:hypothetical protein
VVLAQAVELDVLDDHHLRAVLLEDAVADDLLDGLALTLGQLVEGARHALGRAQQALALGVLTEVDEQPPDQILPAQLVRPV